MSVNILCAYVRSDAYAWSRDHQSSVCCSMEIGEDDARAREEEGAFTSS